MLAASSRGAALAAEHAAGVCPQVGLKAPLWKSNSSRNYGGRVSGTDDVAGG
jgi:hypothetical protein